MKFQTFKISGTLVFYVPVAYILQYTLENIVHYKNSNERYEFSIRAARNISKLRGQREIKPVLSNPVIRNIYVPVAYIHTIP
jgi:hypothetical protein